MDSDVFKCVFSSPDQKNSFPPLLRSGAAPFFSRELQTKAAACWMSSYLSLHHHLLLCFLPLLSIIRSVFPLCVLCPCLCLPFLSIHPSASGLQFSFISSYFSSLVSSPSSTFPCFLPFLPLSPYHHCPLLMNHCFFFLCSSFLTSLFSSAFAVCLLLKAEVIPESFRRINVPFS